LTISGGAVDDDRGGAAYCVIGHFVQALAEGEGGTVACPGEQALMAVAGCQGGVLPLLLRARARGWC
jgi:hypothetical protein